MKNSLISSRFEEIIGTSLHSFNWLRFLNTNHKNCERIAYLLTGYYKTDANAFVNELDVFNDFLLDALFKKDTSLGLYTLGKIGGCLTVASKFAKKYPKLFSLCEIVHKYRLESDLSHPKVKSTNKPTRRIKFNEIKKIIPKISEGYNEFIGAL